MFRNNDPAEKYLEVHDTQKTAEQKKQSTLQSIGAGISEMFGLHTKKPIVAEIPAETPTHIPNVILQPLYNRGTAAWDARVIELKESMAPVAVEGEKHKPHKRDSLKSLTREHSLRGGVLSREHSLRGSLLVKEPSVRGMISRESSGRITSKETSAARVSGSVTHENHIHGLKVKRIGSVRNNLEKLSASNDMTIAESAALLLTGTETMVSALPTEVETNSPKSVAVGSISPPSHGGHLAAVKALRLEHESDGVAHVADPAAVVA